MARRRDDDPFDDIFREIERLVDSVVGRRRGLDLEAGVATDAHVDVHQYEDRVTVIADIPGVSKEDIDVQCTGRTLSIRTAGAHNRFVEQLALPVRVDETSASATYNNGVLEVRLARADDSANIDVE